MKLHDRTRRGVQEAPSMIGLLLLGEACLLQQRDRPGPVVEHEQVNVRHGTMGDGVVQTLGEGGPFQRQTAQPLSLEDLLDPARRIELPHPKRKGLLIGPAQGRSGGVWPTDSLVADDLMEEPSQTLLACGFHEQACARLVGRGG